MPFQSAFQSVLIGTIFHAVFSFVRGGQPGRVGTYLLFQLDHQDDTWRRPDIAFVSCERWPRDRPILLYDSGWEVIPDLAVEVVSPTNYAEEMIGEVREYFQAGTRRVWLTDPGERLVHDYANTTSIRVLGRGDTLDGTTVLPGFTIKVADLFEDVLPRP